MGHEKRTKVIAILALIVAVLGLSVGFSAYTKTLNIQNVQATVQGNENNFSVVFSTASASVSSGSISGSINYGSGTVGSATLSGTTISNLTATFESTGGSGQMIYTFYAYNNGSIPAYLTGIEFGKKTCTGATGTNSELVSAACSDVEVTVYSDNNYTGTNTHITNSSKIDPGKSKKIDVLIRKSGNHSVDGDFTATISSITLNYSSQKLTA